METVSASPKSRRRDVDRSALYASVRPTDVFICTYPKSGTTWLGYLVAQALMPDPTEQLGLDSFNRYVPDINRRYTHDGSLDDFSHLPDPRFFVCHASYEPKFPKVVYVVRDPRDVMVSYWHYQRFLKPDFALSLQNYLERGDHWPCDWDEHVASWLSPRRHPAMLLLRYEDLHADAAGTLRKVLDFAGATCDEARIRRAVEASRFDQMRAAEEKFGLNDKAGDPNERFVRKGKIGGWRDELSFEALRVIQRKYAGLMRTLDYPLAA